MIVFYMLIWQEVNNNLKKLTICQVLGELGLGVGGVVMVGVFVLPGFGVLRELSFLAQQAQALRAVGESDARFRDLSVTPQGIPTIGGGDDEEE
jgi:hypothetical protein